MYSHTHPLRIRYAETDQMGYVYYGNFATFFEVGRVEMMRSMGMTYKNLEKNGIIMPVSQMEIRFLKPVFYDQQITIETTILSLPIVKFLFHYKIYNENKELCVKGSTVLVFLQASTQKPCRCPKEIVEKLYPFFSI